MNTARLPCCLLAFLSLSLGVPKVRADFTAAADLIVAAQGGIGLTETIGYKFTVGATPLVIDALGLNSGTGSLSFTVPVHLWLDGTAIDLASVGINTSDPLSSVQAGGTLQYRYEAITPLLLAANTTYVIGADVQSFQGAAFGGTVVQDSRITVGPTISEASTHPTANSDSLPQHFGPSFQISAVPEPSSIGLIGLSLLGSILLRRTRGGSDS